MGNISIKLNLTQFVSVVKPLTGKDGKQIECIVLPIEKNNFFKGEKGIYVDLIAFELKQKKEGMKDTHSVKQSFSKEYLNSLTEEERNSLPFLGNLTVWGESSSSEKPPVVQDEKSDLPWE